MLRDIEVVGWLELGRVRSWCVNISRKVEVEISEPYCISLL